MQNRQRHNADRVLPQWGNAHSDRWRTASGAPLATPDGEWISSIPHFLCLTAMLFNSLVWAAGGKLRLPHMRTRYAHAIAHAPRVYACKARVRAYGACQRVMRTRVCIRAYGRISRAYPACKVRLCRWNANAATETRFKTKMPLP